MNRFGLGLIALMVVACGSSTTSTSSSGTTATPAPTPPPLSAPAIVQVENSPEGRPQSGLAAADIVYEYVAEGGIGRFSLIFFHDLTAGQLVGPVRSARTVTYALAQQYNGFIMYSGASSYLSGLLSNASFPSYNEDSAQGDLYRVNSRYAPHNLYTDGQHLADLIKRAKLPATSYQLWQRTNGPPPISGAPVQHFTVPISYYEKPIFTWHPELNGFTRTESSSPVKDPKTAALLVVPTVIVQQVAVTPNPKVVDVNGVTGVDHNISSSGKAQVFTGGRVYPVTWHQNDNGPPQFSLPDGSPAPIAPGEVWISLVATGSSATVVPTPTPSPTASAVAR